MMNIEVNNRIVSANPGEMLLDVLKREGIKVPTLCNMEGLFPTGACRMCVVELEDQGRLVPSCAFPVQEGLRVKTHSLKAVESRRTIVELLLASHPDDCLFCVRNASCELRSLAAELGIQGRHFEKAAEPARVDLSSPAMVRDPAKCILCGRCVRVCEEVQGISAIDFIGRGSKTRVGTVFGQGLNVSSCVNCGQCIMVCPTGALSERSAMKEVLAALEDPDKVVVVQHAPAVSVTIGEEFGIKAGRDMDGLMTAALRKLGFKRVFDTSFAADLTIMEEASELVHRLTSGGVVPMMTSCSPGWIKYVEQFYPELLPNLSTCKSPQQMLGAVVKSFFAEKVKVAPEKIFSVSIMPCTAKKFEAHRPEMGRGGMADIDAVLTTRELAQLIRMRGMDMTTLTPESPDTPFGERSSSGKIFGTSGGVMEAAIRTAHRMVTGREMGELKVQEVRGHEGIKEARVKIGDLELGVAVVSGTQNARNLLEQLKAGRQDLHFIEVMTCPGGCVGGGGQPFTTDREAVRARMQALYAIDRDAENRTSHTNEWVQRLYKEFLGEPLGHRSHELLHTHYGKREVYL